MQLQKYFILTKKYTDWQFQKGRKKQKEQTNQLMLKQKKNQKNWNGSNRRFG